MDADSVGAGEVDTNTGSSTPSHDMPANAHQLKLLKPQTESVLRCLSESLDRGSLTMVRAITGLFQFFICGRILLISSSLCT